MVLCRIPVSKLYQIVDLGLDKSSDITPSSSRKLLMHCASGRGDVLQRVYLSFNLRFSFYALNCWCLPLLETLLQSNYRDRN
jgi:hypothetical protein